MNATQIAALAARIPRLADREKFIATLAHADALHSKASQLRKYAWAIYKARGQVDNVVP